MTRSIWDQMVRPRVSETEAGWHLKAYSVSLPERSPMIVRHGSKWYYRTRRHCPIPKRCARPINYIHHLHLQKHHFLSCFLCSAGTTSRQSVWSGAIGSCWAPWIRVQQKFSLPLSTNHLEGSSRYWQNIHSSRPLWRIRGQNEPTPSPHTHTHYTGHWSFSFPSSQFPSHFFFFYNGLLSPRSEHPN